MLQIRGLAPLRSPMRSLSSVLTLRGRRQGAPAPCTPARDFVPWILIRCRCAAKVRHACLRDRRELAADDRGLGNDKNHAFEQVNTAADDPALGTPEAYTNAKHPGTGSLAGGGSGAPASVPQSGGAGRSARKIKTPSGERGAAPARMRHNAEAGRNRRGRSSVLSRRETLVERPSL